MSREARPGPLAERAASRRRLGSAMVEMALLLPLLMLMLFAVVEFGMALQRWQAVSSAAREGARLAATAGCSPESSSSEVQAVENAVESSINNFLSVTGIDSPEIDQTGVCAGTGTNVAVTVRHDFQFDVLGNFVPGLDDIPLTGRSLMRNE